MKDAKGSEITLVLALAESLVKAPQDVVLILSKTRGQTDFSDTEVVVGNLIHDMTMFRFIPVMMKAHEANLL